MKQAQKGVPWIVEHYGPGAFVSDCADGKGNVARMVCEAMAKKRRIFTYYGRDIPRKTVRELSAKYPGGHIVSYDGNPPNADMAFTDTPDGLAGVWHNSIVLYLGEKGPQGGVVVCHFPPEPALWITPASSLPKRSFQVKTRNCVEDDKIKSNIHYSLSLGLPYVPRMAVHGENGVIVSAGPSIVNHIDEVREWEKVPDARIVCVKHSHDMFLDAGIVPWACVLLDPREHVKDFIEEPHPDVKYFVSSTCHPSTFDRLLSRDANIWLYHALVGAGEESLIRMRMETIAQERARVNEILHANGVNVDFSRPFEQADQMVAGGTTAASRGISLLHMMGFRRFTLYGFDSCYWEEKDLKVLNKDGNPKYHKLGIGGKEFYTDAELVAQVQDFKHLQQAMTDVTFDVRGDGMVPAVMKAGWRGAPQLTDIFPPKQIPASPDI